MYKYTQSGISLKVGFYSNEGFSPNVSSNIPSQFVLNYPCNGSSCGYYSINFPIGKYIIECWGAQGGDANPGFGGKGAYTYGVLPIFSPLTLYFYLGEMGSLKTNKSFNGGGQGTLYGQQQSASGGGSTDVRLVNGDWFNFSSLKSRIMVASGGGGGAGGSCDGTVYVGGNGGSGGSLQGYDGSKSEHSNPSPLIVAKGGQSISGGQGGRSTTSSEHGVNGTFGLGGYSEYGRYGGGGGGGYYGGGGSTASFQCIGSGAGGSSYISGYPNCNSISSNSTEVNLIHTNHYAHYSGFVFYSSQMKDYTSQFESPYTVPESGHSGNGNVRIIVIEKYYYTFDQYCLLPNHKVLLNMVLLACFAPLIN